MGDYNVLIVNCGLKAKTKKEVEEIESEIKNRMGLGDSAYHDIAPFISISDSCVGISGYKLSMVVQDKYGSRIPEFLDWLEPLTYGGIGPDECWAIEYTEYSSTPRIRTRNI